MLTCHLYSLQYNAEQKWWYWRISGRKAGRDKGPPCPIRKPPLNGFYATLSHMIGRWQIPDYVTGAGRDNGIKTAQQAHKNPTLKNSSGNPLGSPLSLGVLLPTTLCLVYLFILQRCKKQDLQALKAEKSWKTTRPLRSTYSDHYLKAKFLHLPIVF